ncbi:Cylicin-1, putative [Perkinsus marinus ATCC 50983]|uniref:Cylicin-1, putative n=1 Tax=Perkinsus marinus (strain ATCC 50983 / TXsc) TaxID=423536 RepID=C5KEI8_PERM5|nr:Cylicin-1, putative [Perkinsus marinus ATCC 50983]EER17126.1 Cylicin-1, putative [Perkinsus marinus ATCC 50983]|eukprot:XP_002785330.1 Cylicin-1, putative [Perkinsus marinus ATCC 50983]
MTSAVPPTGTTTTAAVPEVRWIVDTDATNGGVDVDVAKFPPNFGTKSDRSNVAEGGSGFSNVSDDATLTSQRTKVRVELEIGEKKNFNAFKKKEEQIRTARYDEEDSMTLRGASQGSSAIYCGRPTANDTSCWFSLSVDPSNPGIYRLAPVRKWHEFRPLTGVELRMARTEAPSDVAAAPSATADGGVTTKSSRVKEETETEIAEQVMKKQRLADKNDEKRFIRMRAAIELKKAKVKGGETEEGYDAEKAARKEAKRRLKASKAAKHDLETKDVPGSSLSVGKLYAVKHDDEWEGNEDFSDDDELLDDPDAGNEVQIETTGAVDKEKEKMKEARTGRDSDNESSSSSDSEDEQATSLGKAITSIMEKERNKEEVRKEGLADVALDDELLQTGVDPDEIDDDAGQNDDKTRKDTSASATTTAVKANKPSKQDEMVEKLKQLFARNEYRLGLREVLATFPGMKKNSEEYKWLTRSLKDMAEVRDHLLYLKKEYRK